jgi:hypothetical protein
MRALPQSAALYSRTAEDECASVGVTHFNWEGLLTALGISAAGWTIVGVVVLRLLR